MSTAYCHQTAPSSLSHSHVLSVSQREHMFNNFTMTLCASCTALISAVPAALGANWAHLNNLLPLWRYNWKCHATPSTECFSKFTVEYLYENKKGIYPIPIVHPITFAYLQPHIHRQLIKPPILTRLIACHVTKCCSGNRLHETPLWPAIPVSSGCPGKFTVYCNVSCFLTRVTFWALRLTCSQSILLYQFSRLGHFLCS